MKMDNVQPEQTSAGPSVELVYQDDIEAGQRVIELQIRNDSPATVHIFDSPRMPYRILQDDGTLLILHGVNPPDPGKFYYGIEIPLTRPLEAGDAVSFAVNLNQLYLADHYESHREPTPLRGQITVIGQLGWGVTPIVAADRPRMSIQRLLTWQSLSTSDPIVIDLT